MPDYTLYIGASQACDSVSVLTLSSASAESPQLTEKVVHTTGTGPSWLGVSPAIPNRLLVVLRAELVLYDITPTSGEPGWKEFSRLAPPEAQGMCHATFSNDGRYLFAVDFPGGLAGSFRLDEDSITAVTRLTYEGSGGYETLQGSPHPHQARQHPSKPWVFITDLGTDHVQTYHLTDAGELVLKSSLAAPSGTGPRHMAFHPSNRVLYVLGEISGEVMTCTIDDDDGSLKSVGSASALPLEDNSKTAGHNREDGSRGMHPAEILVPSNGKHLYVSNRNQREVSSDQISILDLGSEYPFTAMPKSLRFPPSGGLFVRGMSFNPYDETLLATANQNSGAIGLLRRDAGTGDLTLVTTLKLPSGNQPTSIVWQKA